jgi:hypothetical protein
MPTLITPRTRFLHVPKTGGTWAWRALQAANVPLELLDRPSNGVLGWHCGLDQTEDYADRFTFAFVRHPLAWWRSFWGNRMRHGWEPDHAIDSRARSDDFNDFIEQVVENLPGHFGERLSSYIGPPEAPITFVGRYENVVEDLVRALRLAGEVFDEQALRHHAPENVGDYERFPAHYRPQLAVALAAVEHETIERFYPRQPVPADLLEPLASTSPPVLRFCRPASSPPRTRARISPVVVLGMHRTGTSLVASIIRGLGFDFGAESELMPAHPDDNPHGFFEHSQISDLNDELLSALGGSWWQPPRLAAGWERSHELEPLRERAEAVLATFNDAWAVKDPRMSLTLPFWCPLIGPARYVVSLRHPAEVAASLVRRYRETVVDPGPGALGGREWERIWSIYTVAAMRQTTGAPRCVIDHHRLLTGAGDEIERLGRWLGVPVSAERIAELGGLVDPSLWRQQARMWGVRFASASRWRYRRISLVAARRPPHPTFSGT